MRFTGCAPRDAIHRAARCAFGNFNEGNIEKKEEFERCLDEWSKKEKDQLKQTW